MMTIILGLDLLSRPSNLWRLWPLAPFHVAETDYHCFRPEQCPFRTIIHPCFSFKYCVRCIHSQAYHPQLCTDVLH